LHIRDRQGLRISVTPKLVVNVYAPSSGSRHWVEETLQARAQWIIRTIDRVAACEVLEFPELYSDGQELPYLGEKYRLSIVEGERRDPYLFFDSLILALPRPDAQRTVSRTIDSWYRRRAKEVFQQSIGRNEPVISQHGVSRPEFRIRNMRSRWGSCSSDGRITLNLKLVMIPASCIDYVVMHELCHLVHHNHSKQYYSLLTKCMPDWQLRKKILDRYRMV
jgi:predicted metal-dependent hydrolase